MNNIQYDFATLNRFFNEEYSPEVMKEDIITLVFNYIGNIRDADWKVVRDDIGTLYLLYTQLSNIKAIEGGNKLCQKNL